MSFHVSHASAHCSRGEAQVEIMVHESVRSLSVVGNPRHHGPHVVGQPLSRHVNLPNSSPVSLVTSKSADDLRSLPCRVCCCCSWIAGTVALGFCVVNMWWWAWMPTRIVFLTLCGRSSLTTSFQGRKQVILRRFSIFITPQRHLPVVVQRRMCLSHKIITSRL